jgi:D-alanine--poly(phosphoribitol) ligase subunit 1
MKSSGIFLKRGPLDSKPRRNFLKSNLESLSVTDRNLFEMYGQGPIVPLSYSCIHHPFEDYALKQPEALAVVHGGHSISYRQLNKEADQLALHLLELGVSRGDCVAIFLERSIELIIGILAVAKVGAAYVPQDARIAPTQQLEHVLQVTKAKVILSLSHLTHLVPAQSHHTVIALDVVRGLELESSLPTSALIERASQASEEDVCFVLFTSGTTGIPNGVQVTHRNLCNILLTEPGGLGMAPGLKVSQILNIAFDMSAWEILGSLSHGACLVIRGKDIEATVREVDVVIATPSILSSVNSDLCRQVKVVAVAGEPCPQGLAEKWSQFAQFYNSCGPTEVTIVNTMQLYSKASKQLTIGKPTPNNTVYILNENLEPCAIGEIGEMWAGGDCVSKSYLGENPLNEERYKPDPFLGGERKMFRTRDLGRWTESGELEHYGRTDDQVKIRGFRVELDSISAVLESVPGCLQAVALKLDVRNLVAFVRPANVDLKAAQKRIASLLPYYCAPSLIMALDEFPVTSRGKIDKRELTIRAAKVQGQRDVEVTV